MNLSKEQCRQAICLNVEAVLMSGSDQAYDSYPVRFPTVEIPLVDTPVLISLADRLRIDAGYKPVYPRDGLMEEDCDPDCWYEFSVGLNGYTRSGVDNCVTFEVVNSESDDNEETYGIDLDEEAQTEIRTVLDWQFMEHFGHDCAGILEKARVERKG